MGWIQWYSSLEDHEFLVEVDADYVKDKFNLIGIRETITGTTKEKFNESLKLILSKKVPT